MKYKYIYVKGLLDRLKECYSTLHNIKIPTYQQTYYSHQQAYYDHQQTHYRHDYDPANALASQQIFVMKDEISRLYEEILSVLKEIT